jgi:excisionase family DNA binding protein
VNKQDYLLKVDEFAEALRVTPAAVRRWILERKVNIVKVGRLVRVPASEVQRLIDAGTRRAKV